MNWLYNFVRREKLWPRHSRQWLREDNNARNGSRDKKQRKAKTNMGERHHRYIQMAAASRVVIRGIVFTKTFGQRRPEEDALSE